MAKRRSVIDLDTALKDIFRSRVFDFGTHIEMTLPVDASGMLLPSQVKFNISAKLGGKPILFRYDNTTQEWWVNGACHHPSDPCVVVNNKKVQQRLYKDENGFPHREGGAAEVTRVTSDEGDVYEEFWKISPGINHRTDGGPACTTVQYENDKDLKVWSKFLDRECKVSIPRNALTKRFSNTWKDRFWDHKPVRYVSKRLLEWFENGNPKRANDEPTSFSDFDSFEIIQMSNTLNMKTTTLTGTKEYRWVNEEGKLSRHNGPAIIKLYMVEEVVEGERTISFNYEDMETEWHYNGIKIASAKVYDWLINNDINLQYGENVWEVMLTPEDEFCFISDFLSRIED